VDVVYGDKKWKFNESMTVKELLEKTGLRRDPVLVMANGRLLSPEDVIHADARVLIINAANGG